MSNFLVSEEFFRYYSRKNYDFIYFNDGGSYTLLLKEKNHKYIIRFIFKPNNQFEYKVYFNDSSVANLFNNFSIGYQLTFLDLDRPIDFLDTINSSIFDRYKSDKFDQNYIDEYISTNLNFYNEYNKLFNNK